jgi:FtsH-binding integral membrane protein
MQPNDPNRTSYQSGTTPPIQPNTLSTMGVPQASATRAAAIPREGFLTASFVWMFVGLLVSAGAAAFVMNNQGLQAQLVDAWFAVVIGTFIYGIGLSVVMNRLNALVALGGFFVYSLLIGLMLGVIVAAFATTSSGVSAVVTSFLGASAIFAGAALYGAVTKRDLTSLGGILSMGLLGLIVVTFVQFLFFPAAGPINFVIGVVGVVIFTALTAYDVQKIKSGAMPGLNKDSASVYGALMLYLDFINLFLMLLRIFGYSR